MKRTRRFFASTFGNLESNCVRGNWNRLLANGRYIRPLMHEQTNKQTNKRTNKINSGNWVCERTIPTERPPLVDEVSANVCCYRVPRGQRDGSLLRYSRFSRPEPLLFFQVAPKLYSRGWVDPVPDPLLLRKSSSPGNRTRTSGSVARNSYH
jgi:hypothetical protein